MASSPFRTLRGIQLEAQRHLSEIDWNYLWCGVGDELTVAENTEAFNRWRFRAPLFSGISRPETGTSVLGLPLSFPLFTAPFGNDAIFHPDGHLAVGRAVAALGVQQMVPVAASYTLEEIANASDRASVFQMTMVGDEAATLEVIQRAKAAGYRFICASYSPIRQWRERLFEDSFVPLRSPEDVNFGPGRSDPGQLQELLDFTQPRWSWATMARVAAKSALPIIYKGVLSKVDALRAVEAGAAALYVSNYGGRTLDRVPSTLEILPIIRASVGDQLPIILDSGIRRGSDIATALALGANAVASGRLIALGLAAGGQQGVERVLQLLREEFWMTLGHLGCSRVADLTPEVLLPRGGDTGRSPRR